MLQLSPISNFSPYKTHCITSLNMLLDVLFLPSLASKHDCNIAHAEPISLPKSEYSSIMCQEEEEEEYEVLKLPSLHSNDFFP